MEPSFLIFSGILVGLVLGSFVTMLSYRLPRGLNIVTPPSRCPSCGTRLGVLDLVPVFSWLFAGGKCRHCKTPIGARYILIELLTTTLVTLAFYGTGFRLALLPTVLLIITAMTWSVIKIENQ